MTTDGAPIAGVRVRVRSAAAGFGGRRSTVDDEMTTGDDGRFRFGDLPTEGRQYFTITAAHAAYYSLRRGCSPGTVCTLVLGLGGSLRGRVSVETSDAPCAGMRVRLGSREGGFGEATTDAAGNYRIAQLRPGSYGASVHGANRYHARATVTIVAGVESVADLKVKPREAVYGRVLDAVSGAPVPSAKIESTYGKPFAIGVGPDGRFELDPRPEARAKVTAPGYADGSFWVPFRESTSPEAPRVVRLEPGASVEGVVTKEGGELPAGLRVALEPVQGARSRFGRDGVRVAADGAFRFDGAMVGKPVRFYVAAGMRRLVESEPMQFAPGETRRDVRLTIPAFGAIAGRITDPDGAPVEDARVMVRERITPMPLVRTTTGADGRYTLKEVPVGAQTVEVFAKGFASAEREVEVPTPDVVPDVDFALGVGLSITGSARDAAGNPVPNVSVHVSPLQGGVSKSRHGRSGKDGRYAVAHLAPGVYRLTVISQTHRPEQGRSGPVARAGATGVDLTLIAMAGPLKGVVRDRASGAPVPRFSVRTLGPGAKSAQTFADGDGRFQLARLVSGRHGVIATTEDGRVSQVAEVDLRAGAARPPLELWVESGTSVSGRVLDPKGTPLANAYVFVRRVKPPAGVLAQRRTGPDGAFHVAGLRREAVVVTGTHGNWVQADQRVSLGKTNAPVELRLGETGCSLHVTVVAADGKPVEDAPVVVERYGRLVPIPQRVRQDPKLGLAGRKRLYRTDERGQYTHAYLPADRMTVRVDVERGRGEAEVDLSSGGAKSITIRLAPHP